MGRAPKNKIVRRIFAQMEQIAAEPDSPLNSERREQNMFLEWIDHFLSTGELVSYQRFKTDHITYRRVVQKPRFAT